jgi:hypothetical protein
MDVPSSSSSSSSSPVSPLVVLGELDAAFERAAGVVPGCVAGGEALGWLVGLQGLRARLDALVCRGLAEVDPASIPDTASGIGNTSVSAAVAGRAGVNPRRCRADANLGRWLVDYPVLGEAFGAGRMSRDHVAVIRRVENPRTRAHLGEAQEEFVEWAESLSWVEFTHAVRYWELAADPDGDEPRDQHDTRSCDYRTDADGTVTGRFRLDPVAGAAFTTAMGKIEQRLWRHDQETGSLRTVTQRRADAFIELLTGGASGPLVHVIMGEHVINDLFTRGAGTGCDGGAGGRPDGPGESWPIRYDDPLGRCELIDGTPLHPHHAAAVMTVARFRRLVLGPDGEILDHGRTTRTYPPQLKQVLLVKARGRCQHPGCDAPITWLEADHLIPWNRAGPTNTTNGQILCGPHNKLKSDRIQDDQTNDDRTAGPDKAGGNP